MSDSPAVPSVLGIEAVEWLVEPGENLTVRVTGRWRRRRPAWSGQPTLVIETGGRRARFPAMPEPPSLTGAGPGTWRISFAVPGGLAPDLEGRSWLQFGSVVVPLPAAVAPLGAGAEEHEGSLPDHDPSSSEALSSSGAPSSSEALSPPAEASAAELALRVQALEEDLAAARLQAEELSGSLTERERGRRAAEQRAHAEQALRRDLARQLSVQSDEGQRARQALGELAGAEARIREVEAALHEARRRGDEAEQVAAAAAVARERAERRAVEAEQEREQARERKRETDEERELENDGEMQRERARGSGGAEIDRLRFERGLVGRRAIADRRVPAEPRLAPSPPGPVLPQHSETAREALIAALRRELEVRAGGDAALRARLIDGESRLAARVLIERRTASILGELRRELDELRSAYDRERAARAAAEHRAAEIVREASGLRGRVQQASESITELREALDVSRVTMRELQPPATDDPGIRPDRDGGAEPGTEAEGESATAAKPAPTDSAEPEPASSPAVEPASSPAVEPQRLNDARVRLRQAVAPQETEAGPSSYGLAHTTGRTWLIPIVRRLARTNAVVREWIKRAQSE